MVKKEKNRREEKMTKNTNTKMKQKVYSKIINKLSELEK
jgi:hypothetical protein